MRFTLDDAELVQLAERLAPLVAARLPPPPAAAAPRLLSLGDVAQLLGCTRKAAEMRMVRARARRELHPLERMVIIVDGARRWDEAAVRQWIKGGRR
jgi:hypothetical protein